MSSNTMKASPSTRWKWRVSACTAVTIAAVIAVPSNAYAHLLTHADPDDVSGRFDLRKVSLEREEAELTATVRTFERLRDRHFLAGNAFFVKFDSRGSKRVDFTLRMDYYEGATPHCTLYDRNGFSRYETDGVKGRRSFSCSFPKAELNASRHIRWRVLAVYGGEKDRAPDRGWYAH